MATEILILVLLILANGVFSMAEMAVISARKARLRQRVEEGDKGAVIAMSLAGESLPFSFNRTNWHYIDWHYRMARSAAPQLLRNWRVIFHGIPGWRLTAKRLV